MSEVMKLTGKPSVDKPWLKYYKITNPFTGEVFNMLDGIKQPETTVKQYLRNNCPGMDIAAIQYYGKDFSWERIFECAGKLARALRVCGYKEGDQIPVFWRLVPEFVPLLIAAETIGASILCRDNTIEENIEAAVLSEAKVIFVHSYLSEEEKQAYLNAGIRLMISLDPLRSGNMEEMTDYQLACLKSFYPEGNLEYKLSGEGVMDFDNFVELEDAYIKVFEAPIDINRPLFRAYTSGSTGPSKQVIHSAKTMLDIICQMNFYGASSEFRPTWLVTCLPPALVAVVASMMLLPLSSNKLLIMDPFVFEEDVDLELMHYKPNNWPILPEFCAMIMDNGRIPDDYDVSHLMAAGAGSEAINNTQLRKFEKWMNAHGWNKPAEAAAKAAAEKAAASGADQATIEKMSQTAYRMSYRRITTGYGCSEAGSNVSLPMAPKPLGNGNVGVPMPLATISLFKPGTTEELTYNEIGEICISGPGVMLGYDIEEETKKVIKVHEDGSTWLHIGDLGYMDEDGVLFTVTRGYSPRYGGGDLQLQTMENKVADANIESIKDQFFVIVPDAEHEGCFEPYIYVVLEDGVSVEDVKEQINAAVSPHEVPVEIKQIDRRPFFHFKTNRRGLVAEILAERNA